MNKLLYTLFLLFVFLPLAHSQPTAGREKLTFHFRMADAQVLSDYKQNAAAFARLEQLLAGQDAQPIDSIVVCGSASPEGYTPSNDRLSQQRAIALCKTLRWCYPSLKQLPITWTFLPTDWDTVLPLVEADPATPRRQQVLNILRSPASNATKQANLQRLVGGAYTYIQKRFLPQLRTAVSCIVYLQDVPPAVVPLPPAERQTDSIQVAPTPPDTTAAELARAQALSGYLANTEAFEQLEQLLADLATRPIDSLLIGGSASPEAVTAASDAALLERAAALRAYLLARYPQLRHCPVEVVATLPDWDAVLALVEDNPMVVHRRQVLKILRSDADPATKQARLQQLPGGAYAYLQQYIFPALHTDLSCVLRFRDGTTSVVTLHSSHTTPIVYEHRPLFALKTNLLYDVALTPNLEVEVPIGERWSVNVEYQYGWWLRPSNTRCWQVESGGVEARYWWGQRNSRKVLSGLFTGVSVSVGMYDFQLQSHEGNRGEYYTAGFTGGYAAPLNRSLRLEFSLGVGYVASDYKHYRVNDGELIKIESESLRSVFPTKAKISLVWLLSRSVKKGGTR